MKEKVVMKLKSLGFTGTCWDFCFTLKKNISAERSLKVSITEDDTTNKFFLSIGFCGFSVDRTNPTVFLHSSVLTERQILRDDFYSACLEPAYREVYEKISKMAAAIAELQMTGM